jgi:hypothetical protein
MRSYTATGWPLEVMTKSPFLADLSHCFAGFFFRSLIEIVLMPKEKAGPPIQASAAQP